MRHVGKYKPRMRRGQEDTPLPVGPVSRSQTWSHRTESYGDCPTAGGHHSRPDGALDDDVQPRPRSFIGSHVALGLVPDPAGLAAPAAPAAAAAPAASSVLTL